MPWDNSNATTLLRIHSSSLKQKHVRPRSCFLVSAQTKSLVQELAASINFVSTSAGMGNVIGALPSPRSQVRAVLVKKRTTGGTNYSSTTLLLRSVITMANMVTDPANTASTVALAVLDFLIGLSIIAIVATAIKRRRNTKRQKAMVVDQQWIGETVKGTLFSKHCEPV